MTLCPLSAILISTSWNLVSKLTRSILLQHCSVQHAATGYLTRFWRPVHFQQDSAAAHRTRTTVEFLEREIPEFITLIVWPPNSPDLNLVDYSVWSILQEKMYKICIIDFDDLKVQTSH